MERLPKLTSLMMLASICFAETSRRIARISGDATPGSLREELWATRGRPRHSTNAATGNKFQFRHFNLPVEKIRAGMRGETRSRAAHYLWEPLTVLCMRF